MVKLSQIATDAKSEAEGVWLEYVPGFKVRVASTATKAFREAVDEAIEPYRDLIRVDQGKEPKDRKFTDAMRDDVMRGVMARHILVGWEGLEDDDGKPVPYSPEEAIKLLADPQMHRFVRWIEEAAASAEVYRLKRLESDRKNS